MKVIHSSQIIARVKSKLTAKIVYASVVENTKKLFFPKVTNCFSKQKKKTSKQYDSFSVGCLSGTATLKTILFERTL